MAKYFSPEIETASRDYLHAIQSARLIKTVKRCYENIPFYKAKFDEIGLKPEDIHSIDDISKLPFTVKQDLRDHYPFGLFAVPREELVRVHASSGTTGKQTVVGYTRGDIDRWSECTARACGWTARERAQRPRTTSTSPTATDFSRAVWVFITVRRSSAQRLFPCPPATQNARFRYFRISAQMCSAALRHTLCLSQRHSKR